jgi:hypothetical protein
MSSQRPIKDEMWSDSWFYDLDPSEKLVWVFLLTNERQNVAGVYKANTRWICSNTGFDKQVIESVLSRFEATGKIARTNEWIVLLNHYKHQSTSPKIEEGIARILKEVPEDVLEIYPIHRVCIRYRTLLNLTKLIIGETGSPEKINMWNRKGDDFLEEELQIEPDYKPKKKTKEPKKVSDDIQAVFDLFDNPAKVTWRLREIERVAAQALFDTYGIETLEKRITRIKKEEKTADQFFPIAVTPSQLLDKMPNIERYLGI